MKMHIIYLFLNFGAAYPEKLSSRCQRFIPASCSVLSCCESVLPHLKGVLLDSDLVNEKAAEEHWAHCHVHEACLRIIIVIIIIIFNHGALSWWKSPLEEGELWPWRTAHGQQQHSNNLWHWWVLHGPKCARKTFSTPLYHLYCIIISISTIMLCKELQCHIFFFMGVDIATITPNSCSQLKVWFLKQVNRFTLSIYHGVWQRKKDAL